MRAGGGRQQPLLHRGIKDGLAGRGGEHRTADLRPGRVLGQVAERPGLLLTHSDHLALAPGVRGDLFAEIGTVIDRFGGAFHMPYLAVLVSATRA